MGRRLIDLAGSEARKAGYGSLDLCTKAKMTENPPPYNRQGFTEFDRRLGSG